MTPSKWTDPKPVNGACEHAYEDVLRDPRALCVSLAFPNSRPAMALTGCVGAHGGEGRLSLISVSVSDVRPPEVWTGV